MASKPLSLATASILGQPPSTAVKSKSCAKLPNVIKSSLLNKILAPDYLIYFAATGGMIRSGI